MLHAQSHCAARRSGSTTTLKSEGRRTTVDDLESPRAVDGSLAGDVGDLVTSSTADVCRVAVLGAPKVGKTTLARQLLTSEYLANVDSYHGQSVTAVDMEASTPPGIRRGRSIYSATVYVRSDNKIRVQYVRIR